MCCGCGDGGSAAVMIGEVSGVADFHLALQSIKVEWECESIKRR